MSGDARPPDDTRPDPSAASGRTPFLRVVNGDATPEEIAALVAVLASLGGEDVARPRRTPEWQARHRMVRVNYSHGPGGWRSSGLPR